MIRRPIVAAAAVVVAAIPLGRLHLEGAPSSWTAAMDHSAAAVHTSNERYVPSYNGDYNVIPLSHLVSRVSGLRLALLPLSIMLSSSSSTRRWPQPCGVVHRRPPVARTFRLPSPLCSGVPMVWIRCSGWVPVPTINNQLSVRLCSSVFKVDSMKPSAYLFRLTLIHHTFHRTSCLQINKCRLFSTH